jgi:hypothetical protein
MESSTNAADKGPSSSPAISPGEDNPISESSPSLLCCSVPVAHLPFANQRTLLRGQDETFPVRLESIMRRGFQLYLAHKPPVWICKKQQDSSSCGTSRM